VGEYLEVFREWEGEFYSFDLIHEQMRPTLN